MEIECRVKLDDPERIRTTLGGWGVMFYDKERQEDFIFKRKGEERAVQKPGSFILRIRKTDKKTFLTFKALTLNPGVWEEHEVDVSNAGVTEQILTALGFVKVLELHKERERGTLDGVTFCLDRIEGLGDFLEVEVISENVKEAKRKIGETLRELGFSDKEIIHKGYVAMLFEMEGIGFEGTG